jgi:hypothetical protein
MVYVENMQQKGTTNADKEDDERRQGGQRTQTRRATNADKEGEKRRQGGRYGRGDMDVRGKNYGYEGDGLWM